MVSYRSFLKFRPCGAILHAPDVETSKISPLRGNTTGPRPPKINKKSPLRGITRLDCDLLQLRAHRFKGPEPRLDGLRAQILSLSLPGLGLAPSLSQQISEPRSPSPKPRAPTSELRAPSSEPRAPSPELRAPSPEPRAPSPEIRAPSPELRGLSS
jgi:hypothetical protein